MNKYEVGELVTIHSKDQPQLNGQQFNVVYVQHKPLQAHSGRIVNVSYRLSGSELLFAESALRKAHERACLSYQEMLDYFKNPVKQLICEVV